MSYTYYRRYRSPRRRVSSFQSFCGFVFVGVFLLLLLYAGLRFVNYLWEERRDEAVLTVLRGAATVQEWGESEPRLAFDAESVLIGDTVHTDFEGWAVLRFLDGSELRLDADTTVTLREVVTTDPQQTEVVVSLEQGRVWLHQALNRDPAFQMTVQTSVLDVRSEMAEALIKVSPEQQGLQVFQETVKVLYVDRARDQRTVDTTMLRSGQQTLLTAETQRALLARENVDLLQDFDLTKMEDDFVLWNRDGILPSASEAATVSDTEGDSFENDEKETSPEEDLEEELTPLDETEEELDAADEEPLDLENLKIRLDSPAATVELQKDGIALEGSIVSGEAARVEVTWDGNGQPYVLSGYTAGAADFRYVADAAYGNLRLGVNRYTIKAFDSKGQVSNVLTVTVNASY